MYAGEVHRTRRVSSHRLEVLHDLHSHGSFSFGVLEYTGSGPSEYRSEGSIRQSVCQCLGGSKFHSPVSKMVNSPSVSSLNTNKKNFTSVSIMWRERPNDTSVLTTYVTTTTHVTFYRRQYSDNDI